MLIRMEIVNHFDLPHLPESENLRIACITEKNEITYEVAGHNFTSPYLEIDTVA